MSGPNDVTIKLGLDDTQLPVPVQRVNAAIGSIGKTGEISARQTAAAMRQLPAQFTDIATQLAGGQNPLLILLQQGGQIKDSFGGIGPAIRGVAAAITPAAVGIGALAAGVGVLVTAAVQGSRESAQLRDSLTLTGNAAGMTGARFQAMSEQVAQSTQQTVGGAKGILLQLTSTGQVTNAVMASMATAVGRVADVTGTDARKIAADFAGMGAGVAKWAAEHNKAWNFISADQYRYIRGLEEQGKAEQAMIFVNQRVVEHLEGQRRELGYLESAWDSLGKRASKAWDYMLGIGRDATVTDRLNKVQGDIQAILNASGGNEPARGSASAMRIEALRQQQEGLRELTLLEKRQADARAGNAAANRKEIEEERKREAEEAARRARLKAEPALGAIRSATEQYRSDFLRSEKLADDQVAKEEERQAGLRRKEEETATRRLTAQTAMLQQMADANQRATIELIEDERARGEALIALDIDTARRRIEAQGLAGGARDEALRLLDEQALLSRRRLEVDLRKAGDQLAEDTGKALYDDTRDAISAAFRDSKNPIEAFGNALANTIFTRATSSLVNALATAAVGADGRGGGLGDLLSFIGSISGGGYSVDTSGAGTISPPVPGRPRGGMATGTNYVPRNMLALVHQGEAIIPARYNPAAGGAGAGVTIHNAPQINIEARTDQAQVASLVYGALQQNNAALIEDLQARGMLVS